MQYFLGIASRVTQYTCCLQNRPGSSIQQVHMKHSDIPPQRTSRSTFYRSLPIAFSSRYFWGSTPTPAYLQSENPSFPPRKRLNENPSISDAFGKKGSKNLTSGDRKTYQRGWSLCWLFWAFFRPKKVWCRRADTIVVKDIWSIPPWSHGTGTNVLPTPPFCLHFEVCVRGVGWAAVCALHFFIPPTNADNIAELPLGGKGTLTSPNPPWTVSPAVCCVDIFMSFKKYFTAACTHFTPSKRMLYQWQDTPPFLGTLRSWIWARLGLIEPSLQSDSGSNLECTARSGSRKPSWPRLHKLLPSSAQDVLLQLFVLPSSKHFW